MKTLFFFFFQLFLITAVNSQWTFEANLPNDSVHLPHVWQICIIDSSVSWALGAVHINQNYDYPYFAKRTAAGWSIINTDLNLSVQAKCFTAVNSSKIWLGTYHPEEIYYSSNGGINWLLQYHIADTGHVEGIQFCTQNPSIGYVFADISFIGFWNGVRILRTTNGGLNWTNSEFVLYGFGCADRSMAIVDSNYAWFGVLNILGGLGKIIMTSNGGLNWTVNDVDAGYGGPFTIQFSDDRQTGLFVGETGSTSWFFRTTNSGLNWSTVYTTSYYYSKAMKWLPGTSNIYGTSEFIIVRSTNSGLNWSVMTGGPSIDLECLDAVQINNETIYALAVTWDRKVYRLLDTARLIGIENLGTTLPVAFNLYQNYPNPFNPITGIKYDLPKNTNVTIRIYDIIGSEVTTLVNNEFKNAGRYEVNWNATNYASGIYFYRIEAGDYVSTKKMVLIK